MKGIYLIAFIILWVLFVLDLLVDHYKPTEAVNCFPTFDTIQIGEDPGDVAIILRLDDSTEVYKINLDSIEYDWSIRKTVNH